MPKDFEIPSDQLEANVAQTRREHAKRYGHISGAPGFSPYQSGTVALAPLPIKGIDSSADFSLDSFLFQILALIAVGLSTPDTEFQLHSMIFPIETKGD